MPKVAEIQSQVVETVKKGQELAAETVKGWTETASRPDIRARCWVHIGVLSGRETGSHGRQGILRR